MHELHVWDTRINWIIFEVSASLLHATAVHAPNLSRLRVARNGDMNLVAAMARHRGPIETVVFRNGASSAVRLLGACRLPQGQRVRIWREGQRIIIQPLMDSWPDTVRNLAGVFSGEIPRPP